MKSNQTCRVCGQGGTVGVVVCVECHETFGPFCPEHGPAFAAHHAQHCEAVAETARRCRAQECERKRIPVPGTNVVLEEVYSNDWLTRIQLSTGRAFLQRALNGPDDWKC